MSFLRGRQIRHPQRHKKPIIFFGKSIHFVIRPSMSIIVGQHTLWSTHTIGFMASQCSRRLARCTLVHSCANITVARACALLAIGINLTMLPWQCGGFCMGLQGAKLPWQWGLLESRITKLPWQCGGCCMGLQGPKLPWQRGVLGIAPLFRFPTHRPGQRAQV